jgi:hypothetical protein
VSANEFNCLSNTVLQAGLRCALPVAFVVPTHVQELLQDCAVSDVQAITLRQDAQDGKVAAYVLEVQMCTGIWKTRDFFGQASTNANDTYLLYERTLDGEMQYLHLLH